MEIIFKDSKTLIEMFFYIKSNFNKKCMQNFYSIFLYLFRIVIKSSFFIVSVESKGRNDFSEKIINVTDYAHLIGKLSIIEVGPKQNLGGNLLISTKHKMSSNASLAECNRGYRICVKLNEAKFFTGKNESDFFVCQNIFSSSLILDMIFDQNTFVNFFF